MPKAKCKNSIKAGEISVSNYIGEQDETNTNSANKELLAGPERQQHKAQLSEPINPYKEEIKRIYAKYDRQKEFISIAAHELKSPIVPILGALELIEAEFEETGKEEITLKKEHFKVIVRNTKRLERVASEILDVTRIADQTLNLRKEYFNLSEIIADAIADFREQIKQSNKVSNNKLRLYHEFKNGQGENDTFVYADKGRITQVIYNLLSNAVKFTQEGTISTLVFKERKDDRDEVILSIRDRGTGIHPNILPRLFSIFATKSDTGMGLGLYISKNIVEAHGGNMWGANNADGKGATFSFSLPSNGTYYTKGKRRFVDE
jgi:signal transduction histidine kinase